MKKYIPFFAIALIFFTLSCSNNTQQQSSLNFSISKNLIRTITNESSSDLSLKISISGDTVTEKSFSIQKDSISDETQSFTVENLTAGQTVSVDVSVFCGTIQYYKTKETKTLTLVEGNNSVDIVLEKTLKSAAVWFDGINNYNCYYDLMQLSDYMQTPEVYNSLVCDFIYDPTTSTPIYCFDKSCNLWTATTELRDALLLSKYKMQFSEGLYDTTEDLSYIISEITNSPKDITYDIKNNYLYVLVGDENSNYTLYQLTLGDEPTINASTTISITDSSSTDGRSETLTQIAAYDETIYVGTASGKIYYNTTAFSVSEKSLNVTFDSSIDFTKKVSNFELVKDSYGSEYDNNNYYTSITDLQIGDGLGHETTTLYALVRDYCVYYPNYQKDNAEECPLYSRGYLIEVPLNNLKSSSFEYFGFSTEKTIITDGVSYGVLYAPRASTSVSFYGPTHFAAVVPKKLVILDDGISYKEQSKFDNKDSFVEFDIEEKALTRGAKISATTSTVSSYTINTDN